VCVPSLPTAEKDPTGGSKQRDCGFPLKDGDDGIDWRSDGDQHREVVRLGVFAAVHFKELVEAVRSLLAVQETDEDRWSTA
jgi:hypothetical protein